MLKIGVIGDKDSILGFRALGFDVFPANTADEAVAAVESHANGSYAALYLTEQVAALIPETIQKYRSARLPAIVPIPGVQGTLGIGMTGVRQNVEKAVGADILFREE